MKVNAMNNAYCTLHMQGVVLVFLHYIYITYTAVLLSHISSMC